MTGFPLRNTLLIIIGPFKPILSINMGHISQFQEPQKPIKIPYFAKNWLQIEISKFRKGQKYQKKFVKVCDMTSDMRSSYHACIHKSEALYFPKLFS